MAVPVMCNRPSICTHIHKLVLFSLKIGVQCIFIPFDGSFRRLGGWMFRSSSIFKSILFFFLKICSLETSKKILGRENKVFFE